MPAAYEWTDEIWDNICEQIAEGKSLITVCKAEGMPHISSVMRNLDKKEAPWPARCEQYTRAQAIRTEVRVENLAVVAGDTTRDAQCRRVEMDAIKWIAGKEKPKKYGDRLQIDANIAGATKEQRDAAVKTATGVLPAEALPGDET